MDASATGLESRGPNIFLISISISEYLLSAPSTFSKSTHPKRIRSLDLQTSVDSPVPKQLDRMYVLVKEVRCL